MPRACAGQRQRLHRARARAGGHAAQDDGPKALLQRAGANVPGLLARPRLPSSACLPVQGQDQVQGGPELGRVLQATEKEAIKRGDQFIASELFLLALIDSKGDAGASPRTTA
jgi:ATP-dependent Clp protease ATP-binding subunit ClpB